MKSFKTRVVLFIVVLFLAVLAAFAVMAPYSEPKTEQLDQAAYIAEGLSMAASVKHQILLYFHQQGTWPASNQALGLPDPSAYGNEWVASLAVSNGG